VHYFIIPSFHHSSTRAFPVRQSKSTADGGGLDSKSRR
jgi:hypothetical protein